MKILLSLFSIFVFSISFYAQTFGEFNQPWLDRAIVLDPYHKNKLDIDKVSSDKRIVGIIHKASEGTLVKNKAAYLKRRKLAIQKGFKWGSYHLLTTQDPITQAKHYLKIIGKAEGEIMALDIECHTKTSGCQSASYKVDLKKAKKFIAYVKKKTGRYPILYVNNSVAGKISKEFQGDPVYGKVSLWYARFIKKIPTGIFPGRIWNTYTFWQFAAEFNCALCVKYKIVDGKKECVRRDPTKKQPTCPYTVPGTLYDIDINIYNGSVNDLRNNWGTIGQNN